MEKKFFLALLFPGAWFLASLALRELTLSLVAAGIVAGGYCAFTEFLHPKLKKERETQELEAALPLALLSLAVKLNTGLEIEEGIEAVGKEGYEKAGKEFKKCGKEIRECGASTRDALKRMAEKNNSLELKRAVSQIVSLMDAGGEKKNRAEPLKKIAKEILLKQKHESKKFSSKLVFYSLMFIAFSALAPALFQVFLIAGSLFLDLSLTPIAVLLIVAVFFPSIAAAILAFIRFSTPAHLR